MPRETGSIESLTTLAAMLSWSRTKLRSFDGSRAGSLFSSLAARAGRTTIEYVPAPAQPSAHLPHA
jgi:hypothetical protein